MRLLLDSPVPGTLAIQLRNAGVDAKHISEWQDGQLRNAPDVELLRLAAEELRVVVTNDHGFATLLHRLADAGRAHAGVILLTRRQTLPEAIGSTLRSLLRMADDDPADWLNRAIYLPDAG